MMFQYQDQGIVTQRYNQNQQLDQNPKIISKSLHLKHDELYPKPITEFKKENQDQQNKYVKKVRIIRDIGEDHTNFQNNMLQQRNELKSEYDDIRKFQSSPSRAPTYLYEQYDPIYQIQETPTFNMNQIMSPAPPPQPQQYRVYNQFTYDT